MVGVLVVWEASTADKEPMRLESLSVTEVLSVAAVAEDFSERAPYLRQFFEVAQV